MKKLAAILLLSIFVFNLFGYKLWVYYQEGIANKYITAVVDNNNYNQEDLISIKKTINLPYYNNSEQFSTVDGEVEINGAYYKYVKCRIYNDSLEMLCLPNTQKTKIHQAKNDFYKVVADIEKNNSEKNKSNSNNSFKKILSEFEENVTIKLGAKYTILNPTKYFPLYNSNLGVLHKTTIVQPPDFI